MVNSKVFGLCFKTVVNFCIMVENCFHPVLPTASYYATTFLCECVLNVEKHAVFMIFSTVEWVRR